MVPVGMHLERMISESCRRYSGGGREAVSPRMLAGRALIVKAGRGASSPDVCRPVGRLHAGRWCHFVRVCALALNVVPICKVRSSRGFVWFPSGGRSWGAPP